MAPTITSVNPSPPTRNQISYQLSLLKITGGNRAHIATCIGVHRTGILALDLSAPIVIVWNFYLDHQITFAK